MASTQTNGGNHAKDHQAQDRRGGVRRMARGVEAKAAYASTVAFYRSSGREWAQQLG